MVCNHTEPKAAEFSRLIGGVPYVLDYHDLLKNPEVEAVDIILPVELNCSVTRDALGAGKHVIVEKPIASNLHDAELMTTFVGKYNRVMMVAENCRYTPVYHRIKKMIRDGNIGEPYSVFWNHFSTLETDNKYAKTKWRINHQYPGGFVTDAGVHNIAVLRDIFGEIKFGIASTRSVNPAIGKMDSMSFLFVSEHGVNGLFNTYFSAKGMNENRLVIFGKDGTLVVEENDIILKREGKPDAEEHVQRWEGVPGTVRRLL